MTEAGRRPPVRFGDELPEKRAAHDRSSSAMRIVVGVSESRHSSIVWPRRLRVQPDPGLLPSAVVPLPVELGCYDPSMRPHEQTETPMSVASAARDQRMAGSPTLRL